MPEGDLVERIVRSSLFAKSPRLSDFLQYVCRLAEQGRCSEINEQTIGAAVFGRDPDYDPTIDSIVRSHASRLRHRLRDYFETEGAQEPNILTIPKGSYVPWVEPRPNVSPAEETIVSRSQVGVSTNLKTAETQPRAFTLPITERQSPGARGSHARTIRSLQISLLVVGMIAVAAMGALLFGMHRRQLHTPHHISTDLLRGGSGKTLVVGSDSALVILQHMTQRPVSLDSYTSHEYLQDVASPELPVDQMRKLATRRYMPVIDNSIYTEVVRQFTEENRSVSFRYARDLRPEELKQGDAILLGSRESNPWVQLFEPAMNFYFQDNLRTGVATLQNRHPEPGEQPFYDMSGSGSDHVVYGLVAYRPNLSRSGDVLILEGLTMAGTQTASDFLLDSSSLQLFLAQIRKRDGSIPHFELLLRSVSVAGESSKVEAVAYRVSAD